MSKIEELLHSLSLLKQAGDSAKQTLESIKNQEENIRLELTGYMIDNDIKSAATPDGKYKASVTSRKKLEIKDKNDFIGWALQNREDVLTVDLAKSKKLAATDPEIKPFFRQSTDYSLTFSEVKEKVDQEETQAQWRERVRKGEEA